MMGTQQFPFLRMKNIIIQSFSKLHDHNLNPNSILIYILLHAEIINIISQISKNKRMHFTAESKEFEGQGSSLTARRNMCQA